MTILTGNVQDIGGNAVNGIMRIAATRTRPGNKQNAVIVDRWHAVNINQGRFTTPDLDPGSARIIFEGVGVSPVIEVDIPESGTHRLENIYQQSFEYSPAVIGRAQQAAQQAADHAQKAEKGAQRVGSAKAVLKAVEDAKGYKDASQQASTEALAARDQARSSAQAAEQSKNQSQAFKNQAEAAAGQASSRAATGAQQAIQQRLSQADQAIATGKQQISEQVSAASGHADRAHEAAELAGEHNTNAQQAMTNAQGHASAAASSESEASTAARRAEGARSEARTNWDNAREAQTSAEQARDDAQGHATTAEGHASTASTQATKSENAANRLWDSVAWSGDRLSVAGRQSDSLRGPRGLPGDRGPAGTVDGLEPETIVRTNSEPTFGRKVDVTGNGSAYTIFKMTAGSRSVEQYLTSGGDLGFYDGSNRFVSKPEVFEHHTATDMRGNELRGLPAPTADNHAATKAYVDGLSSNFVTAEDVRNADLVPRSELTEKLENVVRTGDQDTQLGKYLTVDATDQGQASASLFLKKNDHQFEFFTNAAGKFGAWDKRHSRGLFQADRNSFEHQTAVSMGNNQLRGLPNPSGNDHAATKQYVDNAVTNAEVDTSGLATKAELQGKQDRATILTRLAEYNASGGVTATLGIGNSYAVVTDEDGMVSSSRQPRESSHLANKAYVDSQINEVRESSGGGSFWTGSRAEYDRIARKDPNRLYIVGA